MDLEIDDLNRKIENLFQGNCGSVNASKENINLPTTIKSILAKFEIEGLIPGESFSDFEDNGSDVAMTGFEKKFIYERIILLLSGKIIDEQRCRKQTERQIEKLADQNKRQVEVLGKQLSLMKSNTAKKNSQV